MEKTDTGSRRKPGEILRDLRKLLVPEGAKTLSQAKLADQMGYSEEYVQSVESGRKPMQPHFVDEMARFADDARFPDAFDQLIAELRGAVTAYWAGVDLPAATNPDDGGATLAPSPMEEVEGKLDGLRVAVDVLSARTEGRLDGLGGKFDRAEGTLSVLGNKLERTCANAETAVDASARTEAALDALAGKVDEASTSAREQLIAVAAKITDAGDSIRAQAAQTEKKVTRKLDLLIRLLCANFGVGMVGVAAVFILHCHRPPSAMHPTQGGTASVGVGQGAAELSAKKRCANDPTSCDPMTPADGSGELGKKDSSERWVPSEPWKWQALPPCQTEAGEEAINGGCWQLTGVPPPCGEKLWRHGDKCYRPMLPAPKKPVGDGPRQVTPDDQRQ